MSRLFRFSRCGQAGSGGHRPDERAIGIFEADIVFATDIVFETDIVICRGRQPGVAIRPPCGWSVKPS